LRGKGGVRFRALPAVLGPSAQPNHDVTAVVKRSREEPGRLLVLAANEDNRLGGRRVGERAVTLCDCSAGDGLAVSKVVLEARLCVSKIPNL
jgi:hypothetical protein